MTNTRVPVRTEVRAAEALFDEVRDSLVNAEWVIIQIIQTEAWRVLGYSSFAEAWAERMFGVRLATDGVKAHVVYALLASVDVEEVASQTRIDPEIVKALKRQKAAGVPAKFATVRRHFRRKPCKAQTIHVAVTEDEYAAWSASTKARGADLADEAAEVLRRHFSTAL